MLAFCWRKPKVVVKKLHICVKRAGIELWCQQIGDLTITLRFAPGAMRPEARKREALKPTFAPWALPGKLGAKAVHGRAGRRAKKVPWASAIRDTIVRGSIGGQAAIPLPGDRQLSLKKVDASLGVKSGRMAGPWGIERLVGLSGAVSGMLNRRLDIPTYLDRGSPRPGSEGCQMTVPVPEGPAPWSTRYGCWMGRRAVAFAIFAAPRVSFSVALTALMP